MKQRKKCLDANVVLLVSALLWAGTAAAAAAAAAASDPHGDPTDSHSATSDSDSDASHQVDDHSSHPVYAILFPWFSEMLGVLVFFILSRYCHALPFTAVMFLLGMFMGIGVIRGRGSSTDQLTQSIYMWLGIDGHVLLLVFLPGLLFKDAFEVNFHLFRAAFWQLLTMAFPMVLAGTVLTALVGFYIFPYGWSWPLSMTFGSILAATDPVAVSALLNEVGAPPRLKMHVSGESLLNDGSAVVFFTIFSGLFLAELGVEGLGTSYTVGQGFVKFIKMSVGGAVLGILFGLALILLLFLLRRRLDREENIVQITAAMATAYLSFYTAEIVAGTSGVIAVVFCGITCKAYGMNMINDVHMMESFVSLVEHILNTLLFTLAGCVFGAIVADNRDTDAEGWFARDWGYLILLCILVTAIRFLLVFSFYPLLSRIGLKSNIREAIFISFGGLRGAVGIALALSLDAEVWSATANYGTSPEYKAWVTTLFGMVGGVAFFTLVVNGSLSGPLLLKLGLAESSATRKRVVAHFQNTTREHLLDDFIHLLTDPRFKHLDYSVIEAHVPILATLTIDDLAVAVEKNKQNVPPDVYKRPDLSNILPYLIKKAEKEAADSSGGDTRPSLEEGIVLFESYRKAQGGKEGDQDTADMDDEVSLELEDLASAYVPEREIELLRQESKHLRSALTTNQKAANVDLTGTNVRCVELRMIFIEALRHAYAHQVERGEIDGRSFLGYTLFQSLEFAAEEAGHGKPLNDWPATSIASGKWTSMVEIAINRFYSLDCRHGADARSVSPEYIELRLEVRKALAFISAHATAQQRFLRDFCSEGKGEFTAAEQLVLEESKAQVAKAKAFLDSKEKRDVTVIVSHLACMILLNKGARYMEHLANEGLLKHKEAHHFIHLTDQALDNLKYCSKAKHPGELTRTEKLAMMSLDSFKHCSRNLHYIPSSIYSDADKDEEEECGCQSEEKVSTSRLSHVSQ